MTEEGAEEQSIKSSQPKTTEREKRQRHRSGQSEKSKQTLFSYSTSKTEKTPIPSINGSQGVEKLKKQRNPHWDPAWLPDISNIKSTDQRKRFPGGYVRLAPLFIQSSSINTGQSRALRVLNKDCAKVFQNIVPALDPSKIAAALHPKRFFSGSIRQSRIVGAHRKKEELCSESSLKQDFGERRPDVVQLYQKEVLQCCRKTPSFLKYWNQHCKFNSYNLTSKTSRLSVICLPYSNEEASKSNSSPNTSTSVLSVCILSGDQNQQSSNTNKGLTATDLSNLPIDFNKNSIEYTEGAVSIPSRVKKSFTKDTRKLIASIRKAMNSKTKSQIASKKTRGMLQHQQAPRRGRPHGGSNISASFILPYGLEKEIQQSTANVVPSSSSFHGGPLESLQLMSENHQRTVRQQSMSTNGQRLQRKFLDRQKYKMLSKMAGIKQAGHDVKKLTELMDRFHSLSDLYDSKPKTTLRKEKTFVENSRSSPRYRDIGDEFLYRNGHVIPKPIPPVVQRKGRKTSLSTTQEIAKKSSKIKQKEFTAKLHSGKDVDVKVFRLKDSVSEENVLQSVPMSQDDVKYSFHPSSQVANGSEASLYQEALISSRKYVNLNSGNHTLRSHFVPTDNLKTNGILRFDKANTIPDFNFQNRKLQKQKDFQPTQESYGNGMFAEENSQVFAEDMPDTLEKNEREHVSKDMEITRRSIRKRKSYNKANNAMPKTYLKPLVSQSTAVLMDIPEGNSGKNDAEEIFERNLKKATEKITDDFDIQSSIEKIPTILKMPKFVRSIEEIDALNSRGNTGIKLQERGQNLSATSYYISTHPYVTSLSSVSASDHFALSPESRISLGNDSSGRPRTPTNTPQSKKALSSPTRNISPRPAHAKVTDTPRLYPIASIKKSYESNSKSKASDSKKLRRKVLAGSKGKIRKSTSYKDPNLETCVQGRSFTQALNEDDGTESPVRDSPTDGGEKKMTARREKSRSSGSSKKASGKQMEESKKEIDDNQPVFNAYESFVIRSKQPIQEKIPRNSPEIPEIKSSKLTEIPQKKRSPLSNLNTEMKKRKFILARTDKSLSELDQGPVRLVSDPITFSVRHHSNVSGYSNGEAMHNLPKPSKNVLLGKEEESRQPGSDNEDAMIVFYHHETPGTKSSYVQPRLSHKMDSAIPESDELSISKVENISEKEDFELRKSIEAAKKQKTATYDRDYFGEKLNMTARKRLEQLQNDRATFLRLMEDPGLVRHQTLPITKNLHTMVDIEQDINQSEAFSSMWKSLSSNSLDAISHKILSSNYPIKHDELQEKKVEIKNTEQQINRNKQLAFKLNYILPSDHSRRYSFPFGHPVKPPIKPVKSVSSGSDESGSKSLSITELNLDINPRDRHKHWFLPNFGRRVKLQMDKHSASHNDIDIQAAYTTQLSLPDIQRSQFISRVSRDQYGSDMNSETYVYIDPNSAAILPDSSTTYRFAHDVSFDEGSRYRTTDLHNSFKGNLPDHGLNGLSRQLSSSLAMRNHENGLHDLRISNRDHLSNANHITSKDATPSSINRVEDKCDLPPTLSSTSPSMPPAIAASTSNASFIPPPSASRQNAQSSTSAPSSNITFRLHKEKQNWSNRLGELTINGGGYSNSLPGPNTSKTDMEPLLRMNMTSAVQRNLQTRERAMATAPKSRISSRYSSKNGSACSDPNYADPCIAAQPSYQQRLMDLSMLESETVKYERNRKLKRKKNQDKDS